MADGRNSADEALPGSSQYQHPPQERSSSIQLEDAEVKQLHSDREDADVNSPTEEKKSGESYAAPPVQEHPRPNANPALVKQVSDVLSSEVGIPTLLNRLKQSLASAKEFAQFLRKRSVIEDDHAQTLKKLVRTTQDSMHRPEHREGTFSNVYDEMMLIHERMAENGSHFAISLHKMHEELMELINSNDRSRKIWKTNGLAAEQRFADMEQTMRKSKTKYDSLAEEYDRARTGEGRQGGKVLGAFKAHKSAAQQEEDLLKKVQGADQTYHGHVQALQSEKSQLVSSTRPEAVKALQELIAETDSAVGMQMQKFASLNEKLLLGNGLTVSPVTGHEGGGIPQRRSLRQAVASIDNERDLNEFVGAHHTKVAPATEIKYERNAVLGSQTASMSQPPPPAQSMGMHAPQQAGTQSPSRQMSFPPQQPPSMGSRVSTGGFGPPGPPGGPPVSQSPSSPMNQGMPPPGHPLAGPAQGGPPPGGPPQGGPPQDPRQFQQPHNRSVSQGNPLGQAGGPPPQQQQFASRNSAQQPATRFGNNGPMPPQGAPQLGALPFQGHPPPGQSSSPQQSGPPFQPPQDGRGGGPPGGAGPPPAYTNTGPQGQPGAAAAGSAPKKPVFGVPLNRLYERDGLAVPLVVYQCVQAVDLFGLGLEGIYRQSGSMMHINRLKSMFDADSSNPALDFRNPENFYHDVNSVTGLLKQFLRDLPDPLLTAEHHDSFIAASKHDDDIVRRDSLHAIINALPDPNYATLRALALHLHRIMDNAHLNRMGSHNLAVIFGPTLMGSDPSTAITDAGWQIKVIDTILQNTYQIFDED